MQDLSTEVVDTVDYNHDRFQRHQPGCHRGSAAMRKIPNSFATPALPTNPNKARH